uniref:Uncharacterized protein n=1 Tax=Amphiprion ocellaris TaxID=80972 RepID=A0AAQ5YH16_AMPOC
MLSLISKTLITSCEVPDFGGVPPSTAVSVMVIIGCFSRCFCSFKIGILPSLPLSLISKRKWSFSLILYCWTEFVPPSGS